MYIYRVTKELKPLDPIWVHPGELRKILKGSDWFLWKKEPLTIREIFWKETQEKEPKPCTAGIKFNRDHLSCTVVIEPEKDIVFQSYTDINNSNIIKKKMEQRANYRRTRRNRKTRYRKPRFSNRTKKGQLSNTMQVKLQYIDQEIAFIKKILSVLI